MYFAKLLYYVSASALSSKIKGSSLLFRRLCCIATCIHADLTMVRQQGDIVFWNTQDPVDDLCVRSIHLAKSHITSRF